MLSKAGLRGWGKIVFGADPELPIDFWIKICYTILMTVRLHHPVTKGNTAQSLCGVALTKPGLKQVYRTD